MDKAINSLLGLIEGITIDGHVNDKEMEALRTWIDTNADLRCRHPYTELIPTLEQALSDGVLCEDERQDIMWMCENLRSTEYYNGVTADVLRLHGVLAGIGADGIISELELRQLAEWLEQHEHLKTCWPYDEVDSLITGILVDGRIDPNEQGALQSFFSEFVAQADDSGTAGSVRSKGPSLMGLCSVCPQVSFRGRTFCFTGASAHYSRTELWQIVTKFGGEVSKGVSQNVDYLVVGADGNPCWAYACYGRKVQKAVDLRKQGVGILVVHEHDFLDAIEDQT